jgi:hypothetical protein
MFSKLEITKRVQDIRESTVKNFNFKKQANTKGVLVIFFIMRYQKY